MRAFMTEHKAEMKAMRQTKLYTDFAVYSKQKDAERKDAIGAQSHGRYAGSAPPLAARDDPPVVGALNSETRKAGRERKGVWSEFGRAPY